MLHFLLFISSLTSSLVLALSANPIYAFTAYQIIYFFNPPIRWWAYLAPDIPYSFITVCLMIVLLLFNHHKLQNRIFKTPQFIWMYVLLILYGIAYFYAVLPDFHYDALIIYLKLVVTMTIVFKICDTDEKLNIALYGYIFSAWYVSFYIFQIGRNSGLRVERMGPVDSPDANGLAAALSPVIVFCLYYFWTHHNKYLKILFAISGVFAANAIVLINSRGAFLAVASGLMYFIYHLYFSKYKIGRQKLFAVIITISGIFGTLYIADAYFIDRMLSIKKEAASVEDTERESGSTRLHYWKAAIDMSFDHPFGSGWRGFNYHAPMYIPEDVNTGRRRTRSVHSTWFETLSEVGYPGMFAFIMMLAATFITSRKTKYLLAAQKHYDLYYKVVALESMLITYVISMTFLNRMRAEILYWCILFLACAYNIYYLNKINKSECKQIKQGDN